MKNTNMKNLLQGMHLAQALENEDLKKKIVIREEFKQLIPKPTDEEVAQLEENILKEGVRDPLIVWETEEGLVLVDGHNRYSICQKHSLDFPIRKVNFIDDEDARVWMVKNQLGRRNLTPEQQSYFRGLRYLKEKQQGKRHDLTWDQSDTKLDNEKTADRLAKEYGTSPVTIKRDAQFTTGVERIGLENPEIKKEILEGRSKISKKEIQEIGQGKMETQQVLLKEKQQAKPKKHITPQAIAEIAFSFISDEPKSPQEICRDLALQEPVDPIVFFLSWNSSKVKSIQSNG